MKSVGDITSVSHPWALPGAAPRLQVQRQAESALRLISSDILPHTVTLCSARLRLAVI